jgi:hypothetical protein
MNLVCSLKGEKRVAGIDPYSIDSMSYRLHTFRIIQDSRNYFNEPFPHVGKGEWDGDLGIEEDENID